MKQSGCEVPDWMLKLKKISRKKRKVDKPTLREIDDQ